jgi:DNA-binding PadR family transcriptional regulator
MGFWLQECLHHEEWEGFAINSELKHLGHGLKNVTDALNALIDHRPQLVVQLRKSGKTKQARKRYKLTAEGARKVRQMVSSASEA